MDGADRSLCPEFPFCSPRCKLIDLGRWLGEQYAVPSGDKEEESSVFDEENTAS
jgi:endogenous inhibitor of DNA gyrase (YacG/DUF329 family)